MVQTRSSRKRAADEPLLALPMDKQRKRPKQEPSVTAPSVTVIAPVTVADPIVPGETSSTAAPMVAAVAAPGLEILAAVAASRSPAPAAVPAPRGGPVVAGSSSEGRGAPTSPFRPKSILKSARRKIVAFVEGTVSPLGRGRYLTPKRRRTAAPEASAPEASGAAVPEEPVAEATMMEPPSTGTPAPQSAAACVSILVTDPDEIQLIMNHRTAKAQAAAELAASSHQSPPRHDPAVAPGPSVPGRIVTPNTPIFGHLGPHLGSKRRDPAPKVEERARWEPYSLRECDRGLHHPNSRARPGYKIVKKVWNPPLGGGYGITVGALCVDDDSDVEVEASGDEVPHWTSVREVPGASTSAPSVPSVPAEVGVASATPTSTGQGGEPSGLPPWAPAGGDLFPLAKRCPHWANASLAARGRVRDQWTTERAAESLSAWCAGVAALKASRCR
ncbi:MAG: hypothetical protein M1825_004183 [Sarcosagium campestre]|nr:MAG: hypothetical protein M1825_004183 [Sarcosagium campestre]